LQEGNPGLVLTQAYGIAVTLVWCGAVTFVLLKVIGFLVPLRVTQQQEVEGLDITQHGEALQ
jgi:Amt family ammonium transporter